MPLGALESHDDSEAGEQSSAPQMIHVCTTACTDNVGKFIYYERCYKYNCKSTTIQKNEFLIYTVSQKNRTPATFCNNSNSPGSIAIDFDKNNR